MEEADLRGRRFTVLGAARSGVAVARLLRSRGASVFVSDTAPAERKGNEAAELRRVGADFEFGGHSPRVLEADTVVVSPGVPSDAQPVRQAMERQISVVSELEVASWFCPGPIVAITGTNGKTTTTVLTGRMLTDARVPCVVAGNIGTAFSQVVEELPAGGTAVLEVSSFQLDHIATFRPKVAGLLNITPDHLDRYEQSFEKYIAAKQRIFENQKIGDVLIYNEDDTVTRQAVQKRMPAGVRLLPFSTRDVLGRGAYVAEGMLRASLGEEEQEIIATAAISIPGEHNLANAMAATLAALALGVPVASLRATLKNFKGVEHRLEFVRELDGISYVNDSKATNVDAVWYALRSFRQPLIVLVGGRDKGNDYGRLLEPVREHVRGIVAIGESADKVMSAFRSVVRTVPAASMQEAVETARRMAAPGDVVLLSPACASFDWFNDYEHRGRVFKEIVMQLHPVRVV
ncbi:MAG: UDP-N-acetylmuramoyl-L-alanine--D-glutamate ligase [Bacteroidota bacterium]